jgi:hypothetical protein
LRGVGWCVWNELTAASLAPGGNVNGGGRIDGRDDIGNDNGPSW